MKAIKVSDEDYSAIASMIAKTDPGMFQRIFVKVKQKRERAHAAPSATGSNMEYFMAAWRGWPTEVRGKWIAGQGYESRTVLKGSRKLGMDAFFSAMETSNSTARELYAASVAYLLEAPSVKEGWVQNVSTFYGPRKATYMEWLERARQMIEEQDNAERT